MKQSADDNFKFDENSRKFSKWVENTVGKGEIARHEQFLLFAQCFLKDCFPGASKGVIVWEWVKERSSSSPLICPSTPVHAVNFMNLKFLYQHEILSRKYLAVWKSSNQPFIL